MSEPQGGIVPEPRRSALFLLLRAEKRDAEARRAVVKAVARTPALAGKLAELDPRAKLTANVALGTDLWDLASPGGRPDGFRAFREFGVDSHRAPDTGGDLLLHASSERADLCFELALRFMEPLGGSVEVLDEIHGFRYLDERDLTGFIYGAENPKGRARARVALIGEDDRRFGGGSFVLVQRYVLDQAKWKALSRTEQEKVIGRRKADSVELSDRTKPVTAHISRVVIEEEGEELEIVRHSYPYGTVSEHGLLFIAYNRDLDTFEKMLARMTGVSGDELRDDVLNFSQAVSGATFFAPSLRTLRSLAAK